MWLKVDKSKRNQVHQSISRYSGIIYVNTDHVYAIVKSGSRYVACVNDPDYPEYLIDESENNRIESELIK